MLQSELVVKNIRFSWSSVIHFLQYIYIFLTYLWNTQNGVLCFLVFFLKPSSTQMTVATGELPKLLSSSSLTDHELGLLSLLYLPPNFTTKLFTVFLHFADKISKSNCITTSVPERASSCRLVPTFRAIETLGLHYIKR